MQIYVDMDGVLADFDLGYAAAFGVWPGKEKDDVDWSAVRKHKDFYLNLSPMIDMQMLWDYVKKYNPIVLTGIPENVPEADANKRAWAIKNLGGTVEIHCCRSKEKYLHCKPGDLLIDDWTKYKDLWVNAGGLWITHTTSRNTIGHLVDMGI